MRTSRSQCYGAARVQAASQAVQQAAELSWDDVEEDTLPGVARHDVIDHEGGGYGDGARGWTMVADADEHPDRPIGLELGGLGYDVARAST